MRQTGDRLDAPPMITGDDLIASGLKPSPMFGKWLEKTYDWQLEGHIKSKTDGIKRLWELQRDQRV